MSGQGVDTETLEKYVAENKAELAENKADVAENKAELAENKAELAQLRMEIAELRNGNTVISYGPRIFGDLTLLFRDCQT